MFQSLIETRVQAAPRSYGSFGVAFGLHAMLFASAIVGSYLVIGTIQPPDLDTTTLWITNLPPPESGGGNHAVAPPQRPREPQREIRRPEEVVQPTAIPDPVPSEPPPITSTPVVGPDEPGNNDGPGGSGERGGPGNGIGPSTGDGIGPGQGNGPPGGTGNPDPIFVDATVAKPGLLVRVQPKYPEMMRLARIEGRVLVQAVISTTGAVESVEVLSSSNPQFNAAAMEAVRQWRYRPAMQNGRPVAVFFTVEVRFLLQ